MTRAEKITELLNRPGIVDVDDLAQQVLAIADDRTFCTMQELSQLIGRAPNTIVSWMGRGNVQLPEPAYRIARGPIWDRVDIDRWVDDHPEHVR